MIPQLQHHPEAKIVAMSDLVCIAYLIEREAIRRYQLLATEMDSRGQREAAEVFRRLSSEGDRRLQEVGIWAESIAEPVPANPMSWQLPPELAASWDEVRGSTLLTPYRALAVAVDNDERAFAFYAYVAAHATDPRIAAEAEELARAKLRQAAFLRRWRRAAYRQRGADEEKRWPAAPHSAALAALVDAAEAAIDDGQRNIAERLEAIGDLESANLLRTFSSQPDHAGGSGLEHRASSYYDEEPATLLASAQRPLEALSEHLEDVLLEAADEKTILYAQARLESVVARIARITHRLEELIGWRPEGFSNKKAGD